MFRRCQQHKGSKLQDGVKSFYSSKSVVVSIRSTIRTFIHDQITWIQISCFLDSAPCWLSSLVCWSQVDARGAQLTIIRCVGTNCFPSGIRTTVILYQETRFGSLVVSSVIVSWIGLETVIRIFVITCAKDMRRGCVTSSCSGFCRVFAGSMAQAQQVYTSFPDWRGLQSGLNISFREKPASVKMCPKWGQH